MTTIARYKNTVVSDSRYMMLLGDQVGLIDGPAKFYKHRTNKAIICIGGGFTSHGLYEIMESDIDQAMIDLLDYPKTVPAFSNTIAFLSNKKQSIIALRDQVPTVMIVTKELTCIALFFEDKLNEPAIIVYPASLPVAIGSGGENIMPQAYNIKSRDDLIEAVRLAVIADSFSGGKIYTCDIGSMENL